MDTMKRYLLQVLVVLSMSLSLASCITEEQFDNDAQGNFEAVCGRYWTSITVSSDIRMWIGTRYMMSMPGG